MSVCLMVTAAKTKVWSFDVMSAITKSIMVVKASFSCLAHALFVAMPRVNGNQRTHYTEMAKIEKTCRRTLDASGVNLRNWRALKNFGSFRSIFWTTKFLCLTAWVLIGLYLVDISNNNLYLLYDPVFEYCNVITKLKAAMAKIYICSAYDTL